MACTALRKTLPEPNPGCKVQLADASDALRFTLGYQESQIKVEANFGYAENWVLSFYDLYAGKMCATLDRQHPRDLFDIAQLLDHEGLSRGLLETFLVYLIAHKRPMAELLMPTRHDIRTLYQGEFKDMTREPIELDVLLHAREQLIAQIRSAITDADRAFLLSVQKCQPDWSLIDVANAADLPAVKWKLVNLARMDRRKQTMETSRLKRALGIE